MKLPLFLMLLGSSMSSIPAWAVPNLAGDSDTCCGTPSVGVRNAKSRNGAGSSGGGYVTRLPEEWLKQAAQDVAIIISRSNSPILEAPTDRATILEALQPENIVVTPDVSDPVNGQPRYLSYDLATKRIHVLKEFFQDFKATGNESELLPKFRLMLLHEAAHLINIGLGDDNEAGEFAHQILNLDRANTKATIVVKLTNTADTLFRFNLANRNTLKSYRKSDREFELANVQVGTGEIPVRIEIGGFGGDGVALSVEAIRNDGSTVSLTQNRPIQVKVGSGGGGAFEGAIKFDPSALGLWEY